MEYSDDAALMRRQRQFVDEVERSIRHANREVIHARIPALDETSFVKLAREVARLRADYLEYALAAVDRHDSAETSAELRLRREAYEEATHAFEALQRAIKRGYVEIGLPAELAAR